MRTSLSANVDHASARAGLPRPLRLYLGVTMTLTILCGTVEMLCRLLLHRRYPYTWPLMPRLAPFLDFALYEDRFARFHSAAFFTLDGPGYYYPAPMAVVHWLFFQLPHSVDVFLACLCAAFAAGAFTLGRALHRRGLGLASAAWFVFLAMLCCYPFFFEFEQANLEWILCVLVAGGIWACLEDRAWLAALCFALAASMKFYPAVFLGLLLSRRQYRQAAGALLLVAASMLASLWMVCPGLDVSWRGTTRGLDGFRQAYILRFEQVGFDHSLFALGKGVWRMHASSPLAPETLAALLRIYLPVAALAALTLYMVRIRRLPLVNQVICLTVCSILLPPVSYDYTLIHLFAPLTLLALMAAEDRLRTVPGLTSSMLLLAVLMAPETEFIVRGYSIGAQIKCVALIALLGTALRVRFPSRYDDAGMSSFAKA